MVGEAGLIGEVIRILPESCVLQVYEETAGLKIGEVVRGSGAPLSVELGPGLLTTIYDGIQRPLRLLQETCGDFIRCGACVPSLDAERLWLFEPEAEVGAELSGGAILGRVRETASIEHRILLPPDVHGTLLRIAARGKYTLHDAVGTVQTAGGEERPVYMSHRWPVRRKRPVRCRLPLNEPLMTGQRLIDTFFPIAKGGTAAIPGGFGTGKTVTQHNLAKWCDADIIVYIGCGERGNEMTGVVTDFPRLTDPVTGNPLIDRTVMIANTSNMPVAAREASIYTGITIAEYFRDQGYDVALMADSTSRWAEALREISGRLEEMPAEEGFPAYLPSRTADFYERAGRVEALCGKRGSVSAIGAVSPPGGDFSEPVTLHTQRFVKAYWALDKAMASARFFPAINPMDSYSEYAQALADWWRRLDAHWLEHRNEAMRVMQEAEQIKQIVRIMGEEGLSDAHRRMLLADRLIREGFLQQSAFSEKDRYASPEKQALLLSLIMRTVMAIQAEDAPFEEITRRYETEKIIRLKDEVGPDEMGLLRDWETER